MVGCGNSSKSQGRKRKIKLLTERCVFQTGFSKDLYDDGYHNITNIDFAESVIEKVALAFLFLIESSFILIYTHYNR